MNKTKNLKNLFTALAIFAMLGGVILPATIADTSKSYGVKGFDRGISWKPYVPLKKATFVQFDSETYLDDYAYLASVPTAVFYDKNSDQIYTNPLLFYQDYYPFKDDRERVLDSRPGIDYFMEDWMAYCNGKLDKMTLINLQKNKLDSSWDSKNYTLLDGEDPYDLANKIALNDWSYADNAVIAVIQETYEKPKDKTYGTMAGSLSSKEILTEHFEVPKTNNVYPIYNKFNVPDGYKFLKVRSWYPCFYFDIPLLTNMSIPSGDRDIQVYCEKNGQWMMAAISNAWNALEGMDTDKISAYVYNSGKWSVALTDVPTKSLDITSTLTEKDTRTTGYEIQKHHLFFGRYGRIIDILRNMRQVTYQIDVEMYPGVMVEIPKTPPFGCRDAYVNLKWDNPSVSLGFSLIGPSGEEVLSTRENGVSSSDLSKTETDMHIHQLGECLPGEHYSICVFSMSEIKSAVDFTIEYSWQQNTSRMEGDCLASATEGAVLASLLNAPLIYTDPSEVSSSTVDVMYKLGVTNLFIVDLGGYISSKATEQLSEVTKSSTHFTKYDEIYEYIRKITGRNDVIFSTISPWTYWYTAESLTEAVELVGEMPGALSIGPAAYLAAQHGCPVLLVENHAELSAAVVWHTEFWRRHPDGISKLPAVSEMYLTGTRVYNFLKNYDFDKDGEEVIVTVGGQFEIGLTWDRVFVGKGMPGRFIDSPIDLSVWISKTVFYPQIIFQNPALKNPNGVTLTNGSSSERRFPWRGKLGLKITKPSQPEIFKYPVLDTLVCYEHKFNSRASKYWGFTYICADGTIPGATPSLEPIDAGVMEVVNGQKGGFLPDLSASEVQTFYLNKAGYQPVYSTSFEANMYDLNQGVILWLINTHGFSGNGGELMFWHSEADEGVSIPFAAYTKETNPWRAYEWLMGSTEEPDTMTMEIHGILPALAGNPNPKGPRFITPVLDWALAKRPIRDIIGKIFNLPLLRLFAPDWLKDTQDYYDGVVIAFILAQTGQPAYNGTQIDDSLDNIHSVGVSSIACYPAGKYLHLTLMRHGSVFQIMDPWSTSWYSTLWQDSVPRDIALGKTIGEIYLEGISKVGILYISEPPQWWWDQMENVCLYGDPNLRVWVPSTEYSTMNHWESKDVEPLRYDPQDGFSVNGHMPFGVDGYPHQIRKTPITQQLIIFALVIILITIFVAFYVSRRKRKK